MINVNIYGIENLKKLEHRNLLVRSCQRGAAVISGDDWQFRVRTSSYRENKGYNGEGILKLIKSGADDQQKNPDGDIDLDVRSFHAWSNTIAYTYLGDHRRWFNTYILDQRLKQGLRGEAMVFGTVMHELMHGAYRFQHQSKFKRSESVPYKIGTITTECYIAYYSSPKADLSALLDTRFVNFNFGRVA